ncbi:hypothetical protein [Streptomyces umbrinus]|uniref:hypothetical protein n=1 Tax=Streptomyces umbrinus TaxID=67370 RepID=UPI003408A989
MAPGRALLLNPGTLTRIAPPLGAGMAVRGAGLAGAHGDVGQGRELRQVRKYRQRSCKRSGAGHLSAASKVGIPNTKGPRAPDRRGRSGARGPHGLCAVRRTARCRCPAVASVRYPPSAGPWNASYALQAVVQMRTAGSYPSCACRRAQRSGKVRPLPSPAGSAPIKLASCSGSFGTYGSV